MIHRLALVGDPPEDRSYRGVGMTPIIHDTATLEAFVTVDAGTIRPTTVGPGSYLLKRAHVGHDAQVGADCNLATGCIIGGHAEIGDEVKIGLGAVILPYRKVGNGAVIGAGAVVTRDVPAGETVAGNPARILDERKRNPWPYSKRLETKRSADPGEYMGLRGIA